MVIKAMREFILHIIIMAYRIAGKSGGELNLVVWRSRLQPPN